MGSLTVTASSCSLLTDGPTTDSQLGHRRDTPDKTVQPARPHKRPRPDQPVSQPADRPAIGHGQHGKALRSRFFCLTPDSGALTFLDDHRAVSRVATRHSPPTNRCAELNVYCELHSCLVDVSVLAAAPLKGIILSGGPFSVYEEGAPHMQVR